MRKAKWIALTCVLLAQVALAADLASPGDVLQKVAERYKKLRTYQIEAETLIAASHRGQAGSGEEKVLLAVGGAGMFRVERNHDGNLEIRVSDGKITWKALPKQKVWSKQETTQLTEPDDDDESDRSMAQDLFTQTEPDLFEFQPPNGNKEVGDITLPGERSLSLVGQRAADFTLKNIDGSSVHLAELKGKIVLLDFWATGCLPCRRELPTMEAISRKYSDRNVLVFGVNDEEIKITKSFLERNHPDLATLHDANGKVHRLYGCYAIPTVMVIDTTGKIVAHFVGERPESELVAALKQAGMN